MGITMSSAARTCCRRRRASSRSTARSALRSPPSRTCRWCSAPTSAAQQAPRRGVGRGVSRRRLPARGRVNYLALVGWSSTTHRPHDPRRAGRAVHASSASTAARACSTTRSWSWLNGVHLRAMPAASPRRALQGYLEAAGLAARRPARRVARGGAAGAGEDPGAAASSSGSRDSCSDRPAGTRRRLGAGAPPTSGRRHPAAAREALAAVADWGAEASRRRCAAACERSS